MEIKYIQYEELEKMVLEIISKIMIMYGLTAPDMGFCKYLTNTLKSRYGFLTIEQIELAFEYNSIGSLNSKLPRTGNYIDNKVKFTIPDTTKIIKAFCELKGIGVKETDEKTEPCIEQKNEIRQAWCNALQETFDYYKKTCHRLPIHMPSLTCRMMARIGLIEWSDIDKSESDLKGIYSAAANRNMKNYSSGNKTSPSNENLIYQAFDKLVLNCENISGHLATLRKEYATFVAMPY